jgi:hypothetical protein
MQTPTPDLDQEWRDRVSGMLKAEMARRKLGYRELVARLREMGIEDSEKNLSTKISRGNVGAVTFLQCLKAIGCQTIRLDE